MELEKKLEGFTWLGALEQILLLLVKKLMERDFWAGINLTLGLILETDEQGHRNSNIYSVVDESELLRGQER